MNKRTTIQVTKTDAAKRQLETAVQLWFFGGDPVSIHTLAAAALQILHDIGKNHGTPAILRDLQGVDPEYKSQARKVIGSYENFFKHADRDPGVVLRFNPQATEIFLLDAVLTYENLTQEVVPTLSTYKAWILIQTPRLIKDDQRELLLERIAACGTDLTQLPKAEFFRQYHHLLMRIGVKQDTAGIHSPWPPYEPGNSL